MFSKRFSMWSLSMRSMVPGVPINTPTRAAAVSMWARRERENAWPDCICMTDPLAYTVSHSSESPLPSMMWPILPRYDMRRWNPPRRAISLYRSYEEATISAALMYKAGQMLQHIFSSHAFHIVTVQSIVPCRWYSDWTGPNWWRGELQFLSSHTGHSAWPLSWNHSTKGISLVPERSQQPRGSLWQLQFG